MRSLDRQDEFRKEGFDKIVLSHFGEFSIDFISEISERVEEYLISSSDPKHVIKRMFTILIEGMKNVRQHGLRDERGKQIGYLIIGQSSDSYRLEVANLVLNEEIEGLHEYLEKLNAYGIEELRSKYDEALDREFLNTEGSPGLGMIVTRIKTGEQIVLISDQVDDNISVCSFTVSLSRN
jgi:hypothetical protein